MAGVGQPELLWANDTRPCSEMRPASEVLPGPWKSVSDVCCDWQLANLALLHLVIPQVHGIAAHSPVKFTCWCFQMSWPSQNSWRDTDVPPGVRLNTAQPREIPSLDQKTPLCNMQTKELPETCPQGVEMAQPEWSLELTHSTRVGLQVLSRTEPRGCARLSGACLCCCCHLLAKSLPSHGEWEEPAEK